MSTMSESDDEDYEEPPSKLIKYEMASQFLEGEVEEGQEEWLSEDILTDDDYNPATDPDKTESNLGTASREDTMASVSDTLADSQDSQDVDARDMASQNEEYLQNTPDEAGESASQNYQVKRVEGIEKTLNNLDSAENKKQLSELPENLNAFLIRKTDGKVIPSIDESADQSMEKSANPSANQSDDDGNDTDDLLRMLGDNDGKKKKGVSAAEEDGASSDDDAFVFEGSKSKSKSLAVAKNALLKKQPATKAVPEDDDVTDASSDEAATVQKMFSVKSEARNAPRAARSAAPAHTGAVTKHAPPRPAAQASHVKKPNVTPARSVNTRATAAVARPARSLVGQSVVREQSTAKPHIVYKPASTPSKVVHSTPLKQYRNKNQSLLKPTEERRPQRQTSLRDVKDLKPADKERDDKREKQRIMKPEEMDEEVPTDADSESDDESLYDELPSSESEGLEEWFTLDVRAERAGDYLPLLGDRAHKLLSEEKQRVTTRLSNLQKSLSALSDSGKEQAEQLRRATVTLAELDAMLKAT